ncbi:MAG: TraB/GumN family protein [Acidobacteriota bacterium]
MPRIRSPLPRLAWLSLLVVLLAGLARAEPGRTAADSPLFLWEITTPKGTSYLMGSVHAAKPDFYPLDPRLEAAFGQCSALAVEADIAGGLDHLADTVKTLGCYPEGGRDGLERHISSKTRRLFEKLHLDVAKLRQLRPWLAALVVETKLMEVLGFDVKLGIDQHFLDAARQRDLPVRQLESVEAQLHLLADTPRDCADAQLYEALRAVQNKGLVLKKIMAFWQAGDDAALTRLLAEEMAAHPEYRACADRLIGQRNRAMAEVMAGWLEEGTPVFVVVGAAHLVGPDGLVALLRAKGHAVAQVGAGSKAAGVPDGPGRQ